MDDAIEKKLIHEGGNAKCMDHSYYNNKVVTVANSNASYFVSNGTMQHIGTTSAYYCLLERPGVSVINNVEYAYLTNNLGVRIGDAVCKTKASMSHDVVRDSSGTYWFTHQNGYRYRIKDSYHRYCMIKRYGYEGTVATADVNKYKYHSTKITCAEINSYRYKILKVGPHIYYIDGYGRKRHIDSWSKYKCIHYNTGRSYQYVSSTTLSRLPTGSKYPSCKNTGARNRIIRESNGTSWFIDGAKRRYWIPDSYTYNCFQNYGKGLRYNDITRETRDYYRYYGHARCYRGTLLNHRVIRHSDGDAHYISRSGTRYWLGSGSAYWRYRNYTGQYHVNIYSRWLINYIPYGGARY